MLLRLDFTDVIDWTVNNDHPHGPHPTSSRSVGKFWGRGVLVLLFIACALWLLHGWCHVKCCRFGASFVYTIQPCTRLQCHFIQSHIVYACLAVTCHLHFWLNDRDLLRATAVTRGWNGYRNKSRHRKLTLEKKTLPPLLQGFEPTTFQSRVRRFNH